MDVLSFLKIALLAAVQGVAELLPVSSSAHVIVTEKLLGLDPTAPEMTLLLVMLHTGTMLAVILYFWRQWHAAYFATAQRRRDGLVNVLLATLATGVVGLVLQSLIKHVFAANADHFEIEQLFGNARLMAGALAAAGVLIIVSSRIPPGRRDGLSARDSLWIGAVQGLCLPFRGFSRSGATISTALVQGLRRQRAEEFSFALAVVLTPAVVVKEVYRLFSHHAAGGGAPALNGAAVLHLLGPGLLGMVLSFGVGLLALRWLSSWLEAGRWHLFGAYCLLASLVVLWVG